MTEARRIDCPGLMQNNPFPLRVASRNSLRLNATQPGSSYGRPPFAMPITYIRSKLVSAFPDCNRFQENHAGTQLNPTPSASPLALSVSKPVLRFSKGCAFGGHGHAPVLQCASSKKPFANRKVRYGLERLDRR